MVAVGSLGGFVPCGVVGGDTWIVVGVIEGVVVGVVVVVGGVTVIEPVGIVGVVTVTGTHSALITSPSLFSEALE